jgi:ABC-2 type transport system permease protein
MTTTTASLALSRPQIQRSPGHTARIYLKEAKYEFLKSLRLRMYSLSVLSFPIMFYVLFGLVLNGHQAIAGTSVPAYMIASTERSE